MRRSRARPPRSPAARIPRPGETGPAAHQSRKCPQNRPCLPASGRFPRRGQRLRSTPPAIPCLTGPVPAGHAKNLGRVSSRDAQSPPAHWRDQRFRRMFPKRPVAAACPRPCAAAPSSPPGGFRRPGGHRLREIRHADRRHRRQHRHPIPAHAPSAAPPATRTGRRGARRPRAASRRPSKQKPLRQGRLMKRDHRFEPPRHRFQHLAIMRQGLGVGIVLARFEPAPFQRHQQRVETQFARQGNVLPKPGRMRAPGLRRRPIGDAARTLFPAPPVAGKMAPLDGMGRKGRPPQKLRRKWTHDSLLS